MSVMKTAEFNKRHKDLIDKAESFIIEKDENAQVIGDGQIKEGASLLMEFVWSLYENGEIDFV